ncbi:alpha-ribazole phosphatase [Methylohalomonas lacus]|uniref:Alpha-ribazole phosphatase n=1 Tax=Methylohalomonas lacus TaxID=398773 RepID=A0AAE3L160_9GAMM|nr:histidine phosphatase family protein [Methylohalomonas lacus]MCS3902696.1 alpha-ribazole phosphatase [Methylohalomonas lacus]
MAIASAIQLLRHGETAAGQAFIGSSDVALTARGWQQMHSAVSDVTCDRIISSPLQRCAAFAETLAAARGVPVLYEPRWCELDFGAWEGRTAAELMQTEAAALQELWARPEAFVAPAGEAVAAFRRRVLAAWAEHGRADAGRTLVVTHGGVIRVLLAALYPDHYASIMHIDVPHGSVHALAGAAPAVERPA